MLTIFLTTFISLVSALPPQQIPGPSSPSNWSAWLQDLKRTRTSTLASIGYNGSIFDVGQLAWTKTAYIEPQLHPYDRYFYDPITHSYTIDIFLDDLVKRYGGIDAALVWPTYPNIGIDDRNQYDLIRSIPGHEEAMRDIVKQMEARGVKVMWPYNPWDLGTRDTGIPDEESLLNIMNISGASGFFGDTMNIVPESFYDISRQHGLAFALEPEGGGQTPSLNWDTMGWGYWDYPFEPAVDLWKWLEPRHMTHLCDRWGHNRTDALQAAWFNGIGYETWENVWGCWNGIVPRDGEAIRRVAHMLRFFGGLGYLQSEDWVPHRPTLQNDYVFASEFPLWRQNRSDWAKTSKSNQNENNNNDINNFLNETVWTFVNRVNRKSVGEQIHLSSESFSPSLHYFDCYHGIELSLSSAYTLSFEIEPLGFGCVLATPNASTGSLAQFLSEMRTMTASPLSSFSKQWQYLPQTMVESPPTPVLPRTPKEMVDVPAGVYHFMVSGVEVEGNDDEGVDVQFPWEPHPQKNHDAFLQMQGLYVDKYPVTNQQYSAYLQQSKYVPLDPYNFLKNWANGTYPQGWGNKPVTYVSLTEARAFCAFYNKRLPQEVEWQYAAQGPFGSAYPWGDSEDQQRYPVEQHGRTLAPGPADVDAFSPQSDSVFGVADLIGNTWEYTSEFQDDHTRAVILKGGSYYYPSTSSWYFPQAKQLNTHGKYLLMDDAYERAGTLGFRCVSDAPPCSLPICLGFGPSFFPRVDLTSIGELDWMHLGTQNRKKTGQGLMVSLTGSSNVSASFPSTFVWSDGAPTLASSTNVAAVLNLNSSLSISCASSSNYAFLTVFFTVLSGRAQVVANLANESKALNLSLSATNVSVELAYTGGELNVSVHSLSACDGGRLCGMSQLQVSDANLTAMGSLDWVHWGLNTPGSEDRKRNCTQLLSDLTASQQASWFSNNPGSYSWSDGIPNTAISQTSTGLFVSGVGNGFKFTVKGTGSFNTLRVFCGSWQASGKISAQLSSGEVYTETTSTSADQKSFIFTINYMLNVGEDMTVTWIMEDGSGNVTFESAAVASAETSVLIGGITLSSKQTESPTSSNGFRTLVH